MGLAARHPAQNRAAALRLLNISNNVGITDFVPLIPTLANDNFMLRRVLSSCPPYIGVPLHKYITRNRAITWPNLHSQLVDFALIMLELLVCFFAPPPLRFAPTSSIQPPYVCLHVVDQLPWACNFKHGQKIAVILGVRKSVAKVRDARP